MRDWALSFLVVALLAAFLGFGGLALVSVGVARAFFFVFIVLFVATCAMQVVRIKAPPA